jgi:tetratricopeptide (TPR) repeat protein
VTEPVGALRGTGNHWVMDAASIDRLLERGERYLSLEQATEALVAFDLALELDRSSAEALRGRARAHLLLDERESALRDIELVLSTRPDDARAFTLRGRILLLLDRRDQAFADLDRAVALDPRDPEARRMRAVTYAFHRDRPADALTDLNAALELDPDSDPGAYWVRATVKRQLGDHIGALRDVEIALNRLGEGAMLLAERGRILALLRRFDEAHRDLKAAMRLDPNNREYFDLRGQIFVMESGGIRGFARAYFDKAMYKASGRYP